MGEERERRRRRKSAALREREKKKKREEREEERRREREEREKRERREREDDDDDVHGDDSDKRGRHERRTGLSLPCRWRSTRSDGFRRGECSKHERVCSLFLNLKLEWLRSRHEDHQREQRDPNEKFSWKFASDAEVSFPERFVAFEWRERANERELLVRSS